MAQQQIDVAILEESYNEFIGRVADACQHPDNLPDSITEYDLLELLEDIIDDGTTAYGPKNTTVYTKKYLPKQLRTNAKNALKALKCRLNALHSKQDTKPVYDKETQTAIIEETKTQSRETQTNTQTDAANVKTTYSQSTQTLVEATPAA